MTNVTSTEVQQLLADYEISNSDIEKVRMYGKILIPKLPDYVKHFYEWLETQPEFVEHFSDPKALARAQSLQLSYWKAFFEANIDDEFIEHRRTVGEVHARIGLSLPVYFASVNKSLIIFSERLYDKSLSPQDYLACIQAITRLIHLDTAIVVETYSRLTNQKISEQSQALMEMSTPVTAIWKGILMLPIVGIIDSKRAQDIMNAMLSKIGETRSKVIIMDISGVAVVDTAVANHLIKITKATKLMGCECTISGVSPAIAQTIVGLGINVGEVQTTATLRDALEMAFSKTGVVLRRE
ncbi:MAG: STAS domain-containing protein [Nitrospirota bacterium]|nr:MAG: STAS domain-containing protein [Nitrospirota bacterium]